jgi:hypothetical protein
MDPEKNKAVRDGGRRKLFLFLRRHYPVQVPRSGSLPLKAEPLSARFVRAPDSMMLTIILECRAHGVKDFFKFSVNP